MFAARCGGWRSLRIVQQLSGYKTDFLSRSHGLDISGNDFLLGGFPVLL